MRRSMLVLLTMPALLTGITLMNGQETKKTEDLSMQAPSDKLEELFQRYMALDDRLAELGFFSETWRKENDEIYETFRKICATDPGNIERALNRIDKLHTTLSQVGSHEEETILRAEYELGFYVGLVASLDVKSIKPYHQCLESRPLKPERFIRSC